MKLNIQKWGNSAAIRLPSTVLSQIGASIGDAVEVDIEAFRVAKPKYKLDDLLAKCDLQANPPSDIKEWQDMQLVGKEII